MTKSDIGLALPCRLTWHTMVMALAAVIGAFSFAGLVLPPSSASAAPMAVNQCNGFNGSATGATTGVTCTVTVVNTINGPNRGSTTTVTRICTNGSCVGGNGTFITKSTDLVTSVTQCNGSANDAAPPLVTCRVFIINNISSDTPGANSVTAATVNECVGTGTGGGNYGGRGPVVCNPSGASTTGATVTQCNGSVTGGGSTADCSVASASRVGPVIPVRVNQCNGTGNAGGTLLTCSASITNNITPSSVTLPVGNPPIGSPPGNPPFGSPPFGSPPFGSPPFGSPPFGSPPFSNTPQVPRVPTGGVDTGGGSTAGLNHAGLLMLGGGLLLAAAISALVGCRVPRRD